LSGLHADRRCQIQQKHTAFTEFSPTFLKLLINASKPGKLTNGARQSGVLPHADAARALRLFRPIKAAARSALPAFAEHAYRYVLTIASIRTPRTNHEIDVGQNTTFRVQTANVSGRSGARLNRTSNQASQALARQDAIITAHDRP